LGALVAQIGRALRVPVGFENTRDCELTRRGKPGPDAECTEGLSGKSARQAFDYLMTFRPGCSWRELDGVIVVRPEAAWDDPRNVLNFSAAEF
jgi:hypothetical protein